VASYLPGSSMTPHGSTKGPAPIWLSLSAWQRQPSVSCSISASAMGQNAGRSNVSYRWTGRVQGIRGGIHPGSGGGLETVIHGLNTPCRISQDKNYSMSHWLLRSRCTYPICSTLSLSCVQYCTL
jgi:hypothetical protein